MKKACYPNSRTEEVRWGLELVGIGVFIWYPSDDSFDVCGTHCPDVESARAECAGSRGGETARMIGFRALIRARDQPPKYSERADV